MGESCLFTGQKQGIFRAGPGAVLCSAQKETDHARRERLATVLCESF